MYLVLIYHSTAVDTVSSVTASVYVGGGGGGEGRGKS